jgi:copper chaperone NosL
MRSYLAGRFGPEGRVAMALAALVLLPVYFAPVLPVWAIYLRAPQYSEGLTLWIFAHTVGGNLQQVNTLNHYVGMRAISAGDFREFAVLPALFSLFGVWAACAALWGRRWFAALGWALFSLTAVALLCDFGFWLWHYGHDLDPRAPLKMGAFTPPLVGYRKMGNFHVASWPAWGGFLLLLAGGLGPVVLLREWWTARRRRVAA